MTRNKPYLSKKYNSKRRVRLTDKKFPKDLSMSLDLANSTQSSHAPDRGVRSIGAVISAGLRIVRLPLSSMRSAVTNFFRQKNK